MSSKIDYTPYLNVPLSTALFTVDTRDGLKTQDGFVLNFQNPYDINIYKNQQLFSGAVQRISLTEINMPWNVPNVNTYNNVLFLENSLGETHALGDDGITDEFGEIQPSTGIAVGFYTPTTLATAVQSALNNANRGLGVFGVTGNAVSWNVSYIIGTVGLSPVGNANFFRISNTRTSGGPVNFRINPRYGLSKGIGSNGIFGNDKNNRSDTLATMMGFGYASTQYRDTQNSSYASMLYTNYVDIVSSILCKNQDVRDTGTSFFNGTNILARIYISGDKIQNQDNIVGTQPFHLHYEFPTPKEIQWNPTEFLPSCNIQLRDMFGNLLYLASPIQTSSDPQAIQGWATNSAFVQMNMLISEAGNITGKITHF